MTAEQGTHGFAYLDPPLPNPPTEIFGHPTEPIMRLGKVLEGMGYVPGLPYDLGRKIQSAITLFPLLEREKKGESIDPINIRPYRRAIKNLADGTMKGVKGVDSWSLFLSAIVPPVGIPARITLNRKIEKEASAHLPEVLDIVFEKAEATRVYFEHVADFDNPRDQFVTEIRAISQRIFTHVDAAQQAGYTQYPYHSLVAYGIRQTMHEIVEKNEGFRSQIPLMSGFIPDSTSASTMQFPSDRDLAVAAPYVLHALDTVLEPHEWHTDIIDYLIKHPHPDTSLAEIFRSYDMQKLRIWFPQLLPAIRDVLPTNWYEAPRLFQETKNFLRPTT